MPRTGFKGSLSGPNVDVVVDMGNPFLNLTVDGFLKIGSVLFFLFFFFPYFCFPFIVIQKSNLS